MPRVKDSEAESYYESRRVRLVRNFDRFAKRAARSLTRRYGAEFSRDVLADARAEFERIIPEIPYIGGRKNLFTPIMVVNGWAVALYRAMNARGRSAEDVIRVGAEVSDDFFRACPGFVLRLGGRVAFSGVVKRLLAKQAARSQEHRYPEDFVYRLREDDGDDVALIFDECAVNKFYDAQGAQELKPFCNFFDVTYSRLMNMGIDARETIGLGCEQCSLRFKHGRETVIPAALEGVLPRS